MLTADSDDVEQMWVGDVMFDGKHISGTLMNSPNWLTSVGEGDDVRITLGQMTDWMYACEGKVYGAFTVNQIRAKMPPDEREEHDAAWGLEFGDPHSSRVVMEESQLTGEHPMALNMREPLVEHLRENPESINVADDNGWTLLHRQALGGSPGCVGVLLEHGANPNAVTSNGMTPLALANSLGWKEVADLLVSHGART